MKRLTVIAALGVALSMTGPEAGAFEQTGGAGGAVPSELAGQSSPSSPSGVPGVELTVPDTGADNSGFEIRVPGFGVIGKLPKLDFGLELLYGADGEPIAEDEQLFSGTDGSDVTIRGSIRHSF